MEPLSLSVISFGSLQAEMAAHSPYASSARPNGLSFRSNHERDLSSAEALEMIGMPPMIPPATFHSPIANGLEGKRRIQSSRPFKATGVPRSPHDPLQPSPPILSIPQHGPGRTAVRSPSPRPGPLLPPTPTSKTGHVSARCNPALLITKTNARPSTARLPGWTVPLTSEENNPIPSPTAHPSLPPPLTAMLSKPSPEAAQWFKDGPPPTSAVNRQDVRNVMRWVEEQQSALKESVGSSHLISDYDLDGPIVRDLVFVRGGSSEQVGGFLDLDIVSHQEELITTAFEQLCLQVGQQCIDRGRAMRQALMAMKALLRSAMDDRNHALRLLTSVEKELGGKITGLETVQSELKSQLHLSKHEREISQLDVESLLSQLFAREETNAVAKPHRASTSDVTADEERSRLEQAVLAAKSHSESLATQLRMLDMQLVLANKVADERERDLGMARDRERQMERKLDVLGEKLNDTEVEAKTLTPRPKVKVTPPFTAMTSQQTDLVLEAMRSGCSPEDMYRLLTFTSCCGKDVGQWAERFGCIDASGGARETREEPKKPERRGVLSRVPSAKIKAPVSYAATPVSLVAGVNAAFGLGAGPGSGTSMGPSKKLFKLTLPLTSSDASPFSFSSSSFDQLFSFLLELLSSKNVDRLKRHLSGNDLEDLISSISVMMNLGLTSESIALILMGKMSRNGIELWSWHKSLGGILKGSSFENSCAKEMILNLSQACQSTQERLRKMEVSGAVLNRRLFRAIGDEQRRVRREGSGKDAEELSTGSVSSKRKGLSANLKASVSWQALVFTSGRGMVNLFQGLGSGDEVPAPLRFQGTLTNRRLTRQEAVDQCQKIWSAWESEALNPPFASDFLPRHLRERHGRPQAAAEFIYSLIHTCTSHLYCPHLNLFLKVVLGEVEDSLRDEHQELVGTMLTSLSEREVADSGVGGASKTSSHSTGWMPKGEFKSFLAELPAMKKLFSPGQLTQLWESLERDGDAVEDALICYEDLLEPDATGQPSAFVDGLLDLLIESRLDFFTTLDESVSSLGQPEVTPPSLAAAISGLNRNLDQGSLLSLVSRVFAGMEGTDQGVISCPVDEALRLIRVRRPMATGSQDLLSTLMDGGLPKKTKKSKEKLKDVKKK